MKDTILHKKDLCKCSRANTLDDGVALRLEKEANSLEFHFVFDHAGKILWLYDINN